MSTHHGDDKLLSVPTRLYKIGFYIDALKLHMLVYIITRSRLTSRNECSMTYDKIILT